MKFPCEIIQTEYLPLVRKTMVHELRAKGWTQVQIAKALGISQPLISQYLKSSPHRPPSENAISQSAYETGKQAARLFLQSGKLTSAMALTCSQCKTLRDLGPICSLHMKQVPDLQTIKPYCALCHKDQFLSDSMIEQKFSYLTDFKEWLQKALRLPNLVSMIPEIGLQIAYDPLEAQNISEIISIPGRIVKVRSEPVMVSDPEYGGSVTLPEFLLWYRQTIDKTAVIAISYKPKKTSKTFLDSLGVHYIITEGIDVNPHGVRETLRNESKVSTKGPVQLIIDKGSIGYESLAYYFGHSLDDLYDFLVRL